MWAFAHSIGGKHQLSRGLDTISAFSKSMNLSKGEFVEMTRELPGTVDEEFLVLVPEAVKRMLFVTEDSDDDEPEEGEEERAAAILESNIVRGLCNRETGFK